MAGTRKLGRTSDHRRAMLRAMVTYLIENGRVETTVTRAKEVRAVAEKMITLGKSEDLHAKRQVFSYVTKESVAKKLIDEVAPEYIGRSGGYTRITKIGPRRGDAAEMAIIELVDDTTHGDGKKKSKAKKAPKKTGEVKAEAEKVEETVADAAKAVEAKAEEVAAEATEAVAEAVEEIADADIKAEEAVAEEVKAVEEKLEK